MAQLPQTNLLSIRDLVSQTGLSARRIRQWEQAGHFPRAIRLSGKMGHRWFDAASVSKWIEENTKAREGK
jgi:predicted DNA-binding transcriptional regulator AlpA